MAIINFIWKQFSEKPISTLLGMLFVGWIIFIILVCLIVCIREAISQKSAKPLTVPIGIAAGILLIRISLRILDIIAIDKESF